MDIAKKYDYAIKIFGMAENEDIKETMRAVVAEQVDGILFLNDELDQEQMELCMNHFKDAQIPIVLCNVLYGEDIPTVSIDYEKATYEMTKKLLDKGRKNVYLVTTVRRYSVNSHKIKGYTMAMEDAGLEPKIFRTSGDVSVNKYHFQEFLKNNEIDGIIAVRDSIAVSFINEAFRAGKVVPRDISVVGLQNTKYAILSRPALTCVDTPVYDIGAVSMRLLTKFMKHEEVMDSKVVLPYHVVERESN